MKETRFKDTEVGRIPVDWEILPIGKIGYTYTGLSGKTKDDFGGVIHGTSHS